MKEPVRAEFYVKEEACDAVTSLLINSPLITYVNSEYEQGAGPALIVVQGDHDVLNSTRAALDALNMLITPLPPGVTTNMYALKLLQAWQAFMTNDDEESPPPYQEVGKAIRQYISAHGELPPGTEV